MYFLNRMINNGRVNGFNDVMIPASVYSQISYTCLKNVTEQ